jgi:hypothetical protein
MYSVSLCGVVPASIGAFAFHNESNSLYSNDEMSAGTVNRCCANATSKKKRTPKRPLSEKASWLKISEAF